MTPDAYAQLALGGALVLILALVLYARPLHGTKRKFRGSGNAKRADDETIITYHLSDHHAVQGTRSEIQHMLSGRR